MPTPQSSGSDDEQPGETIRKVFESYTEETNQRVHHLDITTDEETNEEFLTAVVTMPAEAGPGVSRSKLVRPLFQAFTRLVVETGLEYPLEVIAYMRTEEIEEPIAAVGAFRVSVLWAQEHGNGNLTLVETLKMVLGTVKRPDSEMATSWIPEYDIGWRQADPGDVDDVPSDFDYEEWAGTDGGR